MATEEKKLTKPIDAASILHNLRQILIVIERMGTIAQRRGDEEALEQYSLAYRTVSRLIEAFLYESLLTTMHESSEPRSVNEVITMLAATQEIGDA